MWRGKKNIHAQQQRRPKTYKHGSNLVVFIEGDTKPRVYEMPHLYPEEPELTSCEVYNHDSTINRVRQAVPTTSLMIDKYDSVIDPMEHEIPTTPDPLLNHDYDYPVEVEIPTIPSMAYGHSSVIKPVIQGIPTTPCKAYDRNSAPDPFS